MRRSNGSSTVSTCSTRVWWRSSGGGRTTRPRRCLAASMVGSAAGADQGRGSRRGSAWPLAVGSAKHGTQRWRRGSSGPGSVVLRIRHLPFQRIPCLLPLLQAASEASNVPVAVALEELIQRDAGHTGGVGAVDDDLVVAAERPERLLGSGKVQRSRDVLCPVLPVAQGVYELQRIPTVQLLLELVLGYQPHVDPSLCPSPTVRVCTSASSWLISFLHHRPAAGGCASRRHRGGTAMRDGI